MAESELRKIDVSVVGYDFEVDANSSQTSVLSIDFDISTANKNSVTALDINMMINGFSTAIISSQITPFDKIAILSGTSIEAVNETRYASSAYAAKRIYDLAYSANSKADYLAELLEGYEGGGGGAISKDVEERLKRLEELSFFEKYDDSTIKTKFNLFSEREISSHGLNAGSGGEQGGGGSETLSGLLDVSLLSPKANDVLIYNGSKWTNYQLSAIAPNIDLTGYLLKTEAAKTYATKSEVSSFLTSSDLTTINSSIVTLNTKVTTLTNNCNSLSSSVSGIEQELGELVSSMDKYEKILQCFDITADGKTVYTTLNFYSEKEISSHGLNVGTGGSTGIVTFDDIIGVSLSGKQNGDVLVYNGSQWTNVPQSSIIPELNGYATTLYVDQKDKALQDKIDLINDWFSLENGVLKAKYNISSDKQISTYKMNADEASIAALTVTGQANCKTIVIDAGQSLQFKDNSGALHSLKFDSSKNAFVFEGNVNVTQELSSHTLNA